MFSTRVTSARWNERTSTWDVRTDRGIELNCRYFVMASGCLSLPKTPEFAGYERFGGASYTTGRWPHSGVDFTGKRVAVIGTGSSGVQAIPLIAKQAAELTVFQRTANFAARIQRAGTCPEKGGLSTRGALPIEPRREHLKSACPWIARK